MRSDHNYWSNPFVSTAFFVGLNLGGLITWVSLFVVFKLAPLTRGDRLIAYYVPVVCVLPWLAGCTSWLQVRKRSQLGVFDRDATGFCYKMIFLATLMAYLAIFSIESALFPVLFRLR